MQAKRWRIRCPLAVSVSLFILPTVCAAQENRSEATAPNPGSTALLSQDGEGFELSPNALQVARIIGVEPLIARLSALTSTKDLNAEPGTSLEELLFRQQITDSIVAASLDFA